MGDYMNIRTDLVAEIKAEKQPDISGVEVIEEQINDVNISTVKILDEKASETLEKPIGSYCTISFPRLDFVCETCDIINATVKALKAVIKANIKQSLVVGLGNTDITPDALGPIVADRVLATRHLTDELKRDLGLDGLKSVSTITPNVLGKTGIESYDLVSATAKKIKPDIIIAVDALACRDPERLCRTIQISNTGIGARFQSICSAFTACRKKFAGSHRKRGADSNNQTGQCNQPGILQGECKACQRTGQLHQGIV